MTLVHPVDEALGEFKLIAAAGSEASKEACAMTLLAWMAGREWTDKPQCAHPLICAQVIAANDAEKTTKAQRAELVRLGVDGVLDTWWIPREVVAYHLVLASKKRKSVYGRGKRLLERIAEWKVDKERPNLWEANLQEANLQEADLRGADLREANLREANLRGANLWGANLWEANLQEANLREADLWEADLWEANLWGAKGNQYTRLPAGWEVNDQGLIVPKKEET